VLLTVLKNGDASTLDIANRIKEMLPTLRAAAPEGMRIELLTDQSAFVSAAIHGVVFEGLIAAALTATMILLFLGSWRSTLIVTISIPLSVLIALVALRFLGQTINVMTLGGLALAVGILVDDATVEIENIHRNLAMGKPLRRAILDGATDRGAGLRLDPMITIVFVSVVFLDGAAKYLFTPMLAVGFSVMASYFLSHHHPDAGDAPAAGGSGAGSCDEGHASARFTPASTASSTPCVTSTSRPWASRATAGPCSSCFCWP
jgi:multidrug efflux pump subunit AcrB